MNRGYTLLWRKIWANPLLCEPGKKFSRLEAWLYLTNILAAGMDDEAAGLRRGDFQASSRYLARKWNWPRSTVQRFFKELESGGMISRLDETVTDEIRANPDLGHLPGQSAGHPEGRFAVSNYETYNPARATLRSTDRATSRAKVKEVGKEVGKEVEKTHTCPAPRDAPVSPKILVEIYRQHNQALPGVKALTSERLRKCRSRVDQAVRDGCLEQYLADFTAAVTKAQQTPFLRGEGARGWRASFDWFIANQVNIYGVLEGKYDGLPAVPINGNGGSHGGDRNDFDCDPGGTSSRRTSRGDLVYVPRQ
jgi:hypothetical protein